MFCDETKIKLTAGRGGDGAVSFRREKFISRGGPDGGDGASGGNVIILADENINTLSELNTKKHYRAQHGEKGRRKNQSGKMGPDLIIKIPVGSIIYNEDKTKVITDLNKHGETYIAAKGGKGGLGNQHFASSVNQAPMFAESGEPGVEKEIYLELKLVADVGLVGLPSVGKSTLIAHISNSRPKIAAYEFTTLIPNLGVVDMRKYGGGPEDSFVVADIPGLIEGASQGKGLGHKFLRHISRTQVLIHIIDPLRTEDPIENFKKIQRELELFDKTLMKKPLIVAINKIDAVDPKEIEKLEKDLRENIPKLPETIYKMSGVTGVGIKELLFETLKKTKKERAKVTKKEEKEQDEEKRKIITLTPHKELVKFHIGKIEKTKTNKTIEVKGARIEQVVNMTDFKNIQGLERVYHFMNKMGIIRALKRENAKDGDIIIIAGKRIPYRD